MKKAQGQLGGQARPSRRAQLRQFIRDFRSEFLSAVIGFMIGVFLTPASPPILQFIQRYGWDFLFPEPIAVVIEGDRVVLVGGSNSTMRVLDVGHEVSDVVIVGSGRSTIVVVATSWNNVFAYNRYGDELWIVDTSYANKGRSEFLKAENDYTMGGSGWFEVQDIEPGRFFSDGKEYIVAISHDRRWAPSQLIVINPQNGEVVFSFRQHGWIEKIIVWDFDGDGNSEILASVVNNRLDDLFMAQQVPYGHSRIAAAILFDPEEGGHYRGPGVVFDDDPRPIGGFKWHLLSYPIWFAPNVTMAAPNYDDEFRAEIQVHTGASYYIDDGGRPDTARSSGWIMLHGDRLPLPPLMNLKPFGDSFVIETIPLSSSEDFAPYYRQEFSHAMPGIEALLALTKDSVGQSGRPGALSP